MLTAHYGAAVRGQGHHGPPGDDLGASLLFFFFFEHGGRGLEGPR
jgi:hypothetical protein